MVAELVLISQERFREDDLATASSLGIDVSWVDSDQHDDVKAKLLSDAKVVIVQPAVFSTELARRCPKLQLVQSVSAGTDRIDVGALAQLGITVANNGGGNAVAVAEHAILLMISTYRKLPLHFSSVRSGVWTEGIGWKNWDEAHELTGKVVGIVGIGAIGMELAKRLKGWDCKLVYNDICRISERTEEQLGINFLLLDDLLNETDVVTLHVPLSENTRGMIGARQLSLMSRESILINTSRGSVIDEIALIQTLKRGEIAGAGLDVLEEEPPDSMNPLLHMDNVVVTPHSASMSKEAFVKARTFALKNAKRVVSGGDPLSVVQAQ